MNAEIQKLAEEAIANQTYKKNINYFWGPNSTKAHYEHAKKFGGMPGVAGWLIQKAYHIEGVQMQVSKQVSDDLLASDFSAAAKLENVPWMNSTVEVYFEDPLLPTILVMKSNRQKLVKMFPGYDILAQDTEYICALMQEGKTEDDTQQLSMQLRPELYDDFMERAEIPRMATGIIGFDLAQIDNAVICYMMHLVLKVFAFVSVPTFKPTPIFRKQMHYGGKPDIKGRPNRPSYRVVYLPSIVRPKTGETNGEGKGHDFKGRRGHIRWYHDERYVNRRGTWDFIRPVADPKTGKYPERTVFKVRKP